MGRYQTIVADPPWEGPSLAHGAGGRRSRATRAGYADRRMTLEEVMALRVGELAAPAAHLYLWATRAIFREGQAAAVARAWGFEPAGEVIWGLCNPGLGAGFLANDHEPVLVARRGGLTWRASTPPGGVAFWRQLYAPSAPGRAAGKIHSAKPDGFLDLVEDVSPGPRIELFARRARLGWDSWGDEALGGDGALERLGGSAGRLDYPRPPAGGRC